MNSFVSKFYFCLAAAVSILTVITLSKSEYILFPDAEWKMELYMLATIWLAWLFPPVAIATFLFLKENREQLSKLNYRVRRLIFAPAVISGGSFVFWMIL